MVTPRRRASDLAEDGNAAGLIDSVFERISQVENSFNNHALQIERRMDQIIEMGRSLAVVQQRQDGHEDDSKELRSQLKDAITDSKTSIERIHKRIDEERTARVNDASASERDCDAKIEAVEKVANGTEKRLDGWLMWGKGIWGALTVCVVAMGWLVSVISSEIKTEREKTQTTLEALKTSVIKIENNMEKTTTIVGAQVELTRRLEQRLADNERQTDMIMQQLRGKR